MSKGFSILPILTITLNGKQLELLTRLVEFGVYGRSVEEVATRLIDEGLLRLNHNNRARA